MSKKVDKIEINDQFFEALDAMNGTAPCIFVTGRAGTGKSTLLRHFRETTDLMCAYLAPTGVAALNIDGETIHSFFRFAPGITAREAKKKGASADEDLFKTLDAIVIDEISMVRADLLDCIDSFLRAALSNKKPFGGVRVIFIGDLYQLPPVVTSHERDAFKQLYETPYFFSAAVVKDLLASHNITFIELEKVYRQQDNNFIELLNGVRNRSISSEQLEALNRRCGAPVTSWEGAHIHLTTTNATADEVNQRHLQAIKEKEAVYHGVVKGTFPEKDFPTDEKLALKKGARVMFVKNDPAGVWVNGTLGTVTKLAKNAVFVRIDGEGVVNVEPVTWTIFRSTYDRSSRQLAQEKIGSFSQIPLRLSWATTIHKSQGKTFDRVVVDLERGAFAAGQVYVALSRCRTLEGIQLTKPVTIRQLLLDYRVMKFLTSLQYGIASQELSFDTKMTLIHQAIDAGRSLMITYLKAKDEKSRRVVEPTWVGEAEYDGHPYVALEAYCRTRRAERVFNIERILEMQIVD